jgi:plastocyanin
MGVRSRLLILALVGAVLALPVAASGDKKPAAEVNAEGNVFTPGSLKFDPAKVSVNVGQIVRWTNTDTVVPHTATEDHGLWNLTGTYGETPANPPGFGPGESRQRTFEAGTQHYYCKVHPTQMRAVVAVPVTLAVHGLADGRRVAMRWAPTAPGPDRAFDVQVKRGAGSWKIFRTGTRKALGKFKRNGPKILISVRARLRKASDAAAHTDWSPVATIKG